MARAAVIPKSPPKRATRTKAKTTATRQAAGETDSVSASKPKPKSRTTKTAIEQKKRGTTRTAAPTTTTTSNADSDEGTDDEIGVIETKEKGKGVKSRGRPPGSSSAASSGGAGRGRKAAPGPTPESESDEEEDELAQTEAAPKKRVGRPPRAKPQPKETAAAKSETAPRPRGRPRTTTTAKTKQATADHDNGVTRKNTRANANVDTSAEENPKQMVITTNSVAMRSNLLRGPAKKKTVTFQDPSDEESDETDEPDTPAAGRRKAAGAPARKPGLGAKPVRKAAATTSGRGRKPAATTKATTAKPLSPKKDKQVAKSLSAYASSDGEDDELSGAKNQVKLVVNSSSKPGLENTGLSSPVKRINLTPKKGGNPIDENGEPTIRNPRSVDFTESLFMSSPAKRPPPSPFTFTMKETPRRTGFTLGSDHKPLSQPNFTPTQNSPLKSSPRKAKLDTPRHAGLGFSNDGQPNLTPGHNSPLKTSPKKGNLGASFSHPPPNSSSTPLLTRSSLLQSPAKRAASPFKSSLFAKLDEPNDHVANATPNSKVSGSPIAIIHSDMDDEAMDDAADEISHEIDEALQPEPEAEAATEYEMEAEMDEEGEESAESHEEQMDEHDNSEDELCGEFESGPESDHDEAITAEVLFGHPEPAVDEQFIEPNVDAAGYFDNHPQHDAREEEVEDSEGDFEVEEEPLQLPTGQEVLEDVLPERPAQSSEESTAHEGAPSVLDDDQPGEHLTDAHESNQDAESSADEDFFYDDEATLVGIDENEQYMATPRRASRRISRRASRRVSEYQPQEAEEPASPVDEVQAVPAPVPSSPIHDHHDAVDSMQFDERDFVGTAMETENEIHPQDEDSHSQTPAQSTPARDTTTRRSDLEARPRLTLLADQFSQWKASSPEKEQPRRRRRGVFSLAPGLTGRVEDTEDTAGQSMEASYPDISRQSLAADQSLLDEESARENDENAPIDSEIHEDQEREQEMDQSDVLGPQVSGRQPMAEIFGDSKPETTESDDKDTGICEPDSLASAANSPAPSTSAAQDKSDDENESENNAPPVFVTPLKKTIIPLRTLHTVSKVPLRPEGEISPLKVSRKRGRSLTGASPARSSARLRNSIFDVNVRAQEEPFNSPRKSRKIQEKETPRTRKSDVENHNIERRATLERRIPSGSPSGSPSSARTPRRNTNAHAKVLGGAVVHVDVHTTEGEDASGIFLELLQQMGARCVKNWAWNPFSSLSPDDGDRGDSKEGRVGITHVVFKDGGVRTLEKVRHAGGLVKCVGVGWVLDCERENKWLDEAQYAVDSSIIPRGGAKRRKSMEPRALSNVNGTLVKVDSTTTSASGRRSGADWNTMEDFMRITPPLRDEPSTPPSNKGGDGGHTEADQDYCQTPKTPGSSAYDFDNLDRIGMSPATPFYLSHRSKLVQQTCPPKQTQQGLFSTSSSAKDDESSRKLRFKLEASRRKSLAYKPKIGSPLVE